VSGDGLLYVALPLAAASLDLSALAVGLILSVNRLVRLASNRVAAHLLTVAPRPAMVGAAVLAVATTAGYGMAPALPLFVALRLAWGCSFSVLRLGSLLVAVADDIATGGRVGLVRGLFRLGSLVGVLVGGWTIQAAGYRMGFAVITAITVLSVPLALVATTGRMSPGPRVVDLRRHGRHRWRAIGFATFSHAFFTQGVLTATAGLVIVQAAGLENVAGAASTVVALRWASEITLPATAGVLIPGGTRTWWASGLLAVSGVACGLTASAMSPWLVVAGLATPAVLAGAVRGLLDAAATDVALSDASPERSLSRYTDLEDLGAALGPFVAAMLATGLPLLYGASGATLVAAAAVLGLSTTARGQDFGA
jgi:hypothetical protein